MDKITAVFKCKMCGGTIEFEQGATVGVCDSCGTKQTLPRLDDEKRANLYDRANHFRRNNDFDKAMGIYEQILNEDNTDAEAYWSLVLCRYGIEYVEDPSTHKRIPTVNRAQFTSIYMDEDYKSALRYADGYQRQIYEEEAKTIDDIQKGILEISSKEEPFDVFICYKETDKNGRRTQDSVLANDLYHQLIQEGFKVFFARITLEDKLGSAYEPYIFAALNSAKVMVVLGTKPEYFNAVWVKNEWSRYLALVKNSGGKKMLIPAYRDMDPYDLPEEFSHLQAQDMSRLGFMQDLIRGIKKIITVDAPKTAVKETVVVNAGNANIAPLLKRAFLFLEDGNWQEADEYCEKVLDQDPENAQAYLGKMMAALQVKKQERLADCDQAFDDNGYYQKVMRFGGKELQTALQGYIKQVNDRNEQARLSGIYDDALKAMKAASTEGDCKKVAEVFRSISDFRDADSLADNCLEKAEDCRKDAIYASAKSKMGSMRIADYENAIKIFESVSGWKDADELIIACQKKIEDIKKKKEIERLEAEKAAKRRKKVLAIGTPIVCAYVVFVILMITVIIPNIKYNSALELMNEGKYREAIRIFQELNDYKDSKGKVAEAFDKYNVEKLKVADVGDVVCFGTYEQDNNTANGKEDIEWIVLAKESSKLLLISDKALDCKPYNTTYTNVTWETCSLRGWMNETFLNEAFSSEEQTQIQITNVSADRNLDYNIDSGNATTDKVFLLSINEVIRYFSDDKARKCVPTAYAKANGASVLYGNVKNAEATCWWWLRSPGNGQGHAVYVGTIGTVNNYGYYVDTDYLSVRPAMWIDVSSINA